jgi:pimeloyl-ACP methyl ester carboxylesterase
MAGAARRPSRGHRFLREHAAALGIDADRLVLLGRSAGGQIATAAAYAEVIPGVRGIVDIYGPTDFDLTWDAATRPRSLDHRYNLEIFLGGNPETARAAYQSASGAMLVTPRAPPTLILHGGLDINVFPEQAELLDPTSPPPACRTRWCRCRGPPTRSTSSTSTRPARRSEGTPPRASWRASRGDRSYDWRPQRSK